MILVSTPSSIKCQLGESRSIIFYGEWTLEPKFYVDIKSPIHWEGDISKKPLSKDELDEAFSVLSRDADAEGWEIECLK